jgi:hypothetical protein
MCGTFSIVAVHQSHLLHMVEVQQQCGMPLEAVGIGQQWWEAVLVCQEMLPCGVPAAYKHVQVG